MLSELDQVRTLDGVPVLEAWLSNPNRFTAEDALDYQSSGLNVSALGAPLGGSREDALLWIARWNGFLAVNSDYFSRIDTVDKLEGANESGKTGVMLTLQTSDHFEELDDVDLFHGLGQRLSQLCHNQSNHIATAGFDDDDEGLSDYGARVVERMLQVGMTVDVSHCSDLTTLQTLDMATRPILITHAPCRALMPGYLRAKDDEMIRKMAKTGGVIGMPVLRFMMRDREPVTVEHYLDHIDHVVELVGVEYVGIGSDQGLDTQDQWPFEMRKREITSGPPKYQVHTNDAYQISIEGINHQKRIFDITEGLIRRRYNDEEIVLILGGNFERALKESWNV